MRTSSLLNRAGTFLLCACVIATLGFVWAAVTGVSKDQCNQWLSDAIDLCFKGFVLLGIAEIINRLPKAEK